MASVQKDVAQVAIGLYHGQNPLALKNVPAIKFTKAEIKKIIDQRNCSKLRIYLAQSNQDNNRDTVVLIGLDDKDNEIIGDIQEYGIQEIVETPLA